MAKIHGTGTRHYIDQYALCTVLNSVDLSMERTISDARTFCQSEKIIGFTQPSSTFAGFGDFGASGWELGFDTLFRAGSNVNHLVVMGSSANSRAYEVVGALGKDTFTFNVGEIVGQNGEIPQASSITRGVTLHVDQAFTTTGAQTGQNHGATTATTDTFVATIRVTAVSGSGSVVFAVQESSDDAAGDPYATISSATGSGSSNVTTGSGTMTFTGVGIGRITTTSATEAYKRINITTFSGFTSVTATVTVGVQAPT